MTMDDIRTQHTEPILTVFYSHACFIDSLLQKKRFKFRGPAHI